MKLQMTEELPDCYVSLKVSPPYLVSQSTYNGGTEALQSATQFNLAWMMLRYQSASSDQIIPPWSGWVSFTG